CSSDLLESGHGAHAKHRHPDDTHQKDVTPEPRPCLLMKTRRFDVVFGGELNVHDDRIHEPPTAAGAPGAPADLLHPARSPPPRSPARPARTGTPASAPPPR